jgi:hypothetical protein
VNIEDDFRAGFMDDDGFVELSTEQFWRKMCDERFIRIGRNVGRIGNAYWSCRVAPEDTPGFMERVVDGIWDDLRLDEPRVSLRGRLAAWFRMKALMRKARKT